MGNKLYNETAIQNIASSIRGKNGTQNSYTVSQMAQAILDIPSGGGGSYNNGKNNFWVYVNETNKNVAINREAEVGIIDWGDGTVDTYTGTNIGHIYTNAGAYIISADNIYDVIVGSGGLIYAELNNATSSIFDLWGVGNKILKLRLNNPSFTSLPSNLSNKPFLQIVDAPYITSIGNSAFYGCTSLTSINFSNVQEISGGAFRNCTSLSGHLDISKATLIGYDKSSGDNGAFMECTGITSATIGAVEPYDSNKRNAAFQYCTGLTTATILGGTSTGRATFSGCSSLRTVYLPNTITEIGNYSFQNCSNLTLYIRATIPPTILSNAFSGATITAIYVPAESVEIYKTATGWSQYALKIQAEPVGE